MSKMSDSDEDMYMPYGERPEWADVTPVPQPKSANPGESSNPSSHSVVEVEKKNKTKNVLSGVGGHPPKKKKKKVWIALTRRAGGAVTQRVVWEMTKSTLADVVRIAYADQYVDTMNYFRAVYATDEKSTRVLDLTREAIAQNGANYTARHWVAFFFPPS